ncbi:MAG: hypothetical protein WCR42_01505 [bacterium]
MFRIVNLVFIFISLSIMNLQAQDEPDSVKGGYKTCTVYNMWYNFGEIDLNT